MRNIFAQDLLFMIGDLPSKAVYKAVSFYCSIGDFTNVEEIKDYGVFQRSEAEVVCLLDDLKGEKLESNSEILIDRETYRIVQIRPSADKVSVTFTVSKK